MQRWAQAHPLTAALAAALLLCLPILGTGWLLDDWGHIAAMHGRIPGQAGGLLNLYTFADGIPANNALRADYCYGWWALPDLKLSFFRPLSVLAHLFDDRFLWPYPTLQHVHGVLWYLACVGAVGLLLRRWLPARTAGLAVLLFAIDDAHWTPAAWLANRNALISVVPAALGWLAWLRGERDGWRWGKALGVLGLALGLCGGETALGLVLLWGVEHLGARRKFMDLWPIGLVLVAYVGVYKALGYGAAASGAYIDPASEPWRFLAYAATRVPTLAGGLLVSAPTELYSINLAASILFTAIGLGALLGLWWLLRRLWPSFELAEQQALPWLLVGCGLALLPPAATWPSMRTTLVATIPSAAVVAILLAALGRLVVEGTAPRWQRWMRGYLWFVHGIWAPVLFVLASVAVLAMGPKWQKHVDAPVLREVGGKRALLVSSPDPLVGFYTPSTLGALGRPEPRSWSVLSAAIGDVAMTRTAPDRLELETLGPCLLASAPEQLVHDPRRVYHVGDRVRGAGFTVEILAVSPEGPTRVAYLFEQPLNGPTWLPLWWHEGRLQRWPLPQIGQRVVIPREIGVLGV